VEIGIRISNSISVKVERMKIENWYQILIFVVVVDWKLKFDVFKF